MEEDREESWGFPALKINGNLIEKRANGIYIEAIGDQEDIL